MRCATCNTPDTSEHLFFVKHRRAPLCGTCLAAENAALRQRVRLARQFVGSAMVSENHRDMLVALLDLRKPLPKGRR